MQSILYITRLFPANATSSQNLQTKRTMEGARVLHMNGGDGETSYAKNSTIQKAIVSITTSVRRRSVVDAYCATSLKNTLSIADLGCSSGPNALLVARDMVGAVEEMCRELGRQPPEFQVLLNDLPGNDFNATFRSLQGLGMRHCFVSGVPGSFYGRLFPKKSLHFVHSSSSLHWLSQVPTELQNGSNAVANKGKLFISNTSSPRVVYAYLNQFHKDFFLFLKCRSEEIVAGGGMVLTMMGRRTANASRDEASCLPWELLAQALMEMASQGLVEEEKIDAFSAPYYAPSSEELKHVIQAEGSFEIECIEIFEASWDAVEEEDHENAPMDANASCSAQRMAKGVRACVESMLASHFGEEIIDELFVRYCDLLEDYYCKNTAELTNIMVSLVRVGKEVKN